MSFGASARRSIVLTLEFHLLSVEKTVLPLAFQLQEMRSRLRFGASGALSLESGNFGLQHCTRTPRGLWTLMPPCGLCAQIHWALGRVSATSARKDCAPARVSTPNMSSRTRFGMSAAAPLEAAFARQFSTQGSMRRKHQYVIHFSYFAIQCMSCNWTPENIAVHRTGGTLRSNLHVAYCTGSTLRSKGHATYLLTAATLRSKASLSILR